MTSAAVRLSCRSSPLSWTGSRSRRALREAQPLVHICWGGVVCQGGGQAGVRREEEEEEEGCWMEEEEAEV